MKICARRRRRPATFNIDGSWAVPPIRASRRGSRPLADLLRGACEEFREEADRPTTRAGEGRARAGALVARGLLSGERASEEEASRSEGEGRRGVAVLAASEKARLGTREQHAVMFYVTRVGRWRLEAPVRRYASPSRSSSCGLVDLQRDEGSRSRADI